jgi:hypothetical protein
VGSAVSLAGTLCIAPVHATRCRPGLNSSALLATESVAKEGVRYGLGCGRVGAVTCTVAGSACIGAVTGRESRLRYLDRLLSPPLPVEIDLFIGSGL